MRKPRDYDAELQALNDKAKQLKTRKETQLGDLVIATGADALGTEVLARVLLAVIGNDDPSRKKAWRERGAGSNIRCASDASLRGSELRSHCILLPTLLLGHSGGVSFAVDVSCCRTHRSSKMHSGKCNCS
ncbi:MAG: conjugal transfer protein TraD, partial [Blastomonas fulva]